MTVRDIVIYPDSFLRNPTNNVEDFDSEEFYHICEDLKDTLESKKAHGVAANQIGYDKNVFAMYVEDKKVKYFVNPSIISSEGSITWREGCLSFPGVEEHVPRFESVKVEYYDEYGNYGICDLEGLGAVACQHEVDHLTGILFIDRVSRMQRRYMLKRLNSYKRKRGMK